MRTHDVGRGRRRGRIARLLAGVAAAAMLAGCADHESPSAPRAAGDPLVERLVSMGFKRSEIVDRGDYFMLEGDIRITKAQVRAMPAVPAARRGGPSFQRYTSTVGSTRHTIHVDLSAVDAEDAVWAAATRAAMANWSGVTGADIQYVEGGTADVTITMYSGPGDCTAATSSFPTSGGAPGPTLVINRSYSGSYSQAQRTWIMTHELGHTFGLMHTDQSNGTLVPGTNTSDAGSVMNSGSTYGGCPPAAPSWSSFSVGDLTAIRYLYPGVSVSISGSQYVTLHQSAPYTANTTNGTGPFSYEWRTRQSGPSTSGTWSSWFSSGTSNVTYASINSCGLNTNYLEARVTDANGKQATASYTIYITNPC
ncbi:MAG: hypothetical protein JO306_09610 [Gemmatimonadetes bacterium]|nr:hypothetical protein [Gemmatimonadota bacterium]